MISSFSSCENLGTIIIPNTFNTENVENMKGLFKDCKNLKTLNQVIEQEKKLI